MNEVINKEYVTLFRCPICGQIYKLYKIYSGDYYDGYITDFNDAFMVDKQFSVNTVCMKCKSDVEFGPFSKVTYDWIATKVFKQY